MTAFSKAILAIAAALTFAAAPASASTWTCDGPAYVCGEPSGKASSVKYKAKAAKAYSAGASSYGDQSGVASWYGGKFHGRKTASGERYNQNAMTAAHKTLPFGTRVQVTNTRTGNTVIVRINDRGPFVKGRVIDLSRAAAGQLGVNGVGPVRLTVLGRG